jgi:ribulose-5-phosphate 4-epimerase/fuculose-1-phosphate aldolase
MDEAEAMLRERLVELGRHLLASGLVEGTSGNLSARLGASGRALVTPSGVDYGILTPAQIVVVDLDGRPVGEGLRPSIDTANHVAILRARPDVGGVVHTHSPYATAFAVVGEPIPPLVTESAAVVGGPIRPIEYLPPGRPDLAERVAVGLGDDSAILLPNHGVIAVGPTPDAAFGVALAVEQGARIAWLARAIGTPRPVPPDEIARFAAFLRERYGQPGS